MMIIKQLLKVFFCISMLNPYLYGECMQWSEFSLNLKPSSLGGIGVFATHDIAAGTLLCTTSHPIRKMKIKDVPADWQKFCVFLNDEECFVPERFDRMEIGWFINHSATPNVAIKDPIQSLDEIDITSPKAYPFYALKEIKAGDEILIDYNYLQEPEQMKEDFYKTTQTS